MLTVADNVATRGQISYNLGLQTTGIQPLAAFVLAAVDQGVRLCHGGEWATVRAVLLLGVALLLLFAFQLASIAASVAARHKQAVFTWLFC